MSRSHLPAWVALTVAALALGRAFADSTPPVKPPPGKRTPLLHRAQTEAPCTAARPAGNANSAWPGCKRDADCTGGKNGRCVAYRMGNSLPSNQCSYDACITDGDCATKARFCSCGSGAQGNYCVSGNCSVDADCGQGGFCSPSSGDGPAGACGRFDSRGYYCHTAGDTCVDDEDCAGPGDRKSCAWQPLAGHWGCVANLHCPVG